jgi:uncharacterized 2Fe-2S/4Fe-4S cluster protein (DUF4445 family)
MDDKHQSAYTPNAMDKGLGIAIDLGTTHICVAVCDLHFGTRVTSYIAKNPQSELSAEIITRLIAALDEPHKAEWLQKVAFEAIAQVIETASEKVEISEIKKVFFVGNTAMLSILVGANFEQLTNPETWALKVGCNIQDTASITKTLGLADSCELAIIQPLGGFVGSDLLAGVVSEKIYEKHKIAMLIDFGTNSEIALWDKNRFWVTSTAGGPAFEGGGISCGMPAIAGAIYKITVKERGEYEYHTIDDAPAIGLCGSGLVDALAILLQEGHIAKNGRIKDGSKKLTLPKSQFFITSGDIDAIQRAKAAIAAGIETLCHDAGVDIASVQEYYISGAFGKYINTSHATAIGLLPDLSQKSVKTCGNSALNGCQDMLTSQDALNEAEKIREILTLTNLGTNEFFEDSFFKRLFF